MQTQTSASAVNSDFDSEFALKHRQLCNTGAKHVKIGPDTYVQVQATPTSGELLLTGNTCFFENPDDSNLVGVTTNPDPLVKLDPVNCKAVLDGIDRLTDPSDVVYWYFALGNIAAPQPSAQQSEQPPQTSENKRHDLVVQIGIEPRVYSADTPPKLLNKDGTWDAQLAVSFDSDDKDPVVVAVDLKNGPTVVTVNASQVPEGIRTLTVRMVSLYKAKAGIGVLRYAKVLVQPLPPSTSSSSSTSSSTSSSSSGVASSSVQLGVVRARWRPAAVHTKFSSSKTSRVCAWVCQQRKVDDALLGAFSPMKSGAGGYMGIGLDSDGRAGNGGMPFSCWVHGDDELPPPTSQWAFFTAIGHPGATVRVFRHEGTGVKIEDFKNMQWVGNVSKTYATCLKVNPVPFARVEGGGVILTFTAFWFDEAAYRPLPSGQDNEPPVPPEKGAWRLYGEVQAYKKEYKDLELGGFIEVTGGLGGQMTGDVVRGVEYQIHAKDRVTGTWHPVDRMHVGDAGKISEKQWTVNADTKKFEVRGGGIVRRMLPATKTVQLPPSSAATPPAYMKYISDIDNLTLQYPEITAFESDDAASGAVVAVVHAPGYVEGASSPARLTVFYGAQDQLTLTSEWPLSVDVEVTSSVVRVRLPTDQFVAKDLPQGVALPTTGYGGPENTVLGFTGTMFARAKFIDAALQTFSRTTATVQLPLQYPVVEVAAPKRLRRV
jgi:hypothetical protein